MNTNEILVKVGEAFKSICPRAVYINADEGRVNVGFTGNESEQFSIAFEYGTNNGRVSVHGNFHFHVKGTPTYINPAPGYSVTISASRTPEAIAKDILRRFCPAYRTAYEAALEQVRRDRAYNDTIASHRAAFEKATGDTIAPHITGNQFRLYINRRAEDSIRLEISLCRDSAGITVGHLPVEKALRLIQLIKSL